MSRHVRGTPLRGSAISLGASGAWIASALAYTIHDSRSWTPRSFDPPALLLRAAAITVTVILLLTFFATWRERIESFLLPDWGHSLAGALLVAFGGYVAMMRTAFELTPATEALGLASLTIGALGMSWFMSAAATKVAAFLRYLRPPPRVNVLGAAIAWALGAPAAAAALGFFGWSYGLRPRPEVPDALFHLALVLTLSVPTMKLATIVPEMRGPSRWLVSSMLGGYLAGFTASAVMLAGDLFYIPPLLTDLWGTGSVAAAGVFALPSLLYFSGSTSLLPPPPPELEELDGPGLYLVEVSPGTRFAERLYISLRVRLDDGRPTTLMTRRGSTLDLFRPLISDADLVIYLSTLVDFEDHWHPGARSLRIPATTGHVSRALRRLAEVRGAVIILDSLTDLVAINGHDGVAGMLSSIRPRLESSGAILLATIFPEAHSEAELTEFELIADEVVDLRRSGATSKPGEEILLTREARVI